MTILTMLKKKISFQISHLKSLLESESSCVTVVNNFKGKLSLLPFHLGYLKHAVKELLDNKVSKYDPELNGIILGHSNIKVINYLQHSDSSKIDLSYIADIYLFTPAVGKNLTGLINKKSKEHIGCLIHTAFNASIPKPRNIGEDLSIWLRTHGSVQIGNQLDFTVSKVDFSSRVPYISGIIVRTDSDYHEEEADSGCCQDSIEDSGTKIKKKKRKSKENSLENDSQNEVTSYHDPDKISELLSSNVQESKGKRKKSEKYALVGDSSCSTPPPSKKIKKEKKSPETEDNFPQPIKNELNKSSLEDSSLPVPIAHIKKERLSPLRTETSSSSRKSKSKQSLGNNETFNLEKVKSEPSVEELTSSLLKQAMRNISPKPSSSKKKSKTKTDILYKEEKLELDSIATKKQKRLSFPEKEVEIKVETNQNVEESKGKKRKRSDSPVKSESEDSFMIKSKKKKSKRSKHDLDDLASSLLADTISKLN